MWLIGLFSGVFIRRSMFRVVRKLMNLKDERVRGEIISKVIICYGNWEFFIKL